MTVRAGNPKAWAASIKLFCRRNAILPAIRLAITGMPVMPTTTMT